MDDDEDSAIVRSKGIGIMADGAAAPWSMRDELSGQNVEWRIARRTLIPRQRPLHFFS